MTTLFLTKLAAILNYFSAAVESAFKDDIFVEAHSFPPPNVARYIKVLCSRKHIV
jgi:hypothetical protein